MFVRLHNLEPTLAETLIDERSKIENNQGSSHFIVDPAGAPLRFFRSSKFDDRKSNPNNRFKKTQRGFETIQQESTFDNPLRLQPIFSKVMGKGFTNYNHWAKIMAGKGAGGYIEPYKIQTTGQNRSK